MQTIWKDPVEWTGRVVGTWLRFSFFAVIMNFLLVAAIYSATVDGWRSAIGFGGIVAVYQLMFLYVMRRLFVLVAERKQGGHAA